MIDQKQRIVPAWLQKAQKLRKHSNSVASEKWKTAAEAAIAVERMEWRTVKFQIR